MQKRTHLDANAGGPQFSLVLLLLAILYSLVFLNEAMIATFFDIIFLYAFLDFWDFSWFLVH